MMSASNREDLILAHMPQVELLAPRLHRRCPQAELDDLISARMIGLIQAVDRFDPSGKLELKTLAEHRISGALLGYLRRIDLLPRNVRRFQKRCDAVITEFTGSGEVPSQEQIAKALGVPTNRYIRLSLMITESETISIDEPVLARRLIG